MLVKNTVLDMAMTFSMRDSGVCVVCGISILVVINFWSQNVFSSEDKYLEIRESNGASIRRKGLEDVDMPREGFVITMQNESGWEVALELQRVFEIEKMHVVLGHVGHVSRLPLYNRHLMESGRTDDLQIGNLNMLGCLETHRDVWKRVSNTSYVFEHDAKPNLNSRGIVQTLLRDIRGSAWSVLMLQKPYGFLTNSLVLPENNQFRRVGEIGETCRNCIAYGTRGYIVNKAGAEILLENYSPTVVQVDAYISLLNAYHDNFTLVWTRVQAVDWIPQLSTIQDIFEVPAWNSWTKKMKHGK